MLGGLALVAMLAGGPLGMCLALAYGVVHFVKVAKVDSQYAAKGEMPPSAKLIDKWLDQRATRGKKPIKPAKYGMWRYAWLRWRAMWEDLSERFEQTRSSYRKARDDAKATGRPLPPKPTFKETLTGWKWEIDHLTAPAGRPEPADVESGAGNTAPAQAPPAVDESNPPEPPVPAGSDGAWPCPGCGLKLRSDNPGERGQECAGCVSARKQPATRICPGCGMEVSRDFPRHYDCKPTPTTSGQNLHTRPAGITTGQQTEGENMTAPTTQQSGEVTGLMSAINYADAVAAAHNAHSLGGGEQYRASLGEAKVGPETIQSAAHAQELSEMAGAAWKAHADKLREQLAAKEATTAETGSKEFLLSE